MHQQPPKTPLFASTSLANASQLDSSRALIVYPDRTSTQPRVRQAVGTRLGECPLPSARFTASGPAAARVGVRTVPLRDTSESPGTLAWSCEMDEARQARSAWKPHTALTAQPRRAWPAAEPRSAPGPGAASGVREC